MGDIVDRQTHPMEPVGRAGDEIVPDRLSTIPEGIDEPKPKDELDQTLLRTHPHDKEVLKVLLKKDRLSMQKFWAYCVRGYLDADPYMLKFLKTSRQLDAIPKDVKDKHVLSHRERAAIYDQIEKEEGK